MPKRLLVPFLLLPLIFCLLFSAAGLARAQPSPLPVEQAFALAAQRDGNGAVVLKWDVQPGYYLYRENFAVTAADGTPVPFDLPPGHVKDDPNFGTTEIFEEDVSLVLPADARGLLEVTFQGCQDKSICYAPVTTAFDTASLAFGATGAASASSSALPDDVGTPSKLPIRLAEAASSGMLSALAEQGGAGLVIGSFLVFGLALAFTPCVFPMYPILAGSLARSSAALTGRRALSLSLSYVAGMATAFGLLGVAAAWSGQNLQVALQSSWAFWIVAGIFVLLAFSMFGLFELQLPSAWTTFVTRRTGNGSGHAGTAALGFTSALIVGPCVTAPLAAALLYVAQTGDMLLGAAALFALGLGKGIPLILFGILGARLLPKAGGWMEGVKRLFGFVFVAAAIWMLERVLPTDITPVLWGMFLTGAGGYLVAIGAGVGPARLMRASAVALGALSLVAAGSLLGLSMNSAWSSAPSEHAHATFVTTRSIDELSQALAAADGRPSLVYVTAEWCVSCEVIEREIWSNPEALLGMGDVQLIKADVSANDAANSALTQSLGVYGPPTMIFADANAAEVADSRLIGEVDVQRFRDAARAAGMLQ